MAAEIIAAGMMMAVEFEAGGEGGVDDGVLVEDLAVAEFGSVLNFGVVDDERGLFGNERFGGSPPADADFFFQESVDGVEGSAGMLAEESDVLADDSDVDAFGAEGGYLQVADEDSGTGRIADV